MSKYVVYKNPFEGSSNIMKSNLELPDEVYLTTLLTLPIVFLPYNKNGKTN